MALIATYFNMAETLDPENWGVEASPAHQNKEATL
jgi:hypothetical protein